MICANIDVANVSRIILWIHPEWTTTVNQATYKSLLPGPDIIKPRFVVLLLPGRLNFFVSYSSTGSLDLLNGFQPTHIGGPPVETDGLSPKIMGNSMISTLQKLTDFVIALSLLSFSSPSPLISSFLVNLKKTAASFCKVCEIIFLLL